MEKFNFTSDAKVKYINALKAIIANGINLGLSLQDLVDKLERIQKNVEDGIIRIVILGSFSDGKTSSIAGLLGRLDDSMKIDQDESSDELVIYRPDGLKKGFEIVDTPGLFGSKEKEVNGSNIKLSDITKKYLSEAHIVIYVCDAVTPLKESHVPVLRWILRDLDKLNSTIFVINKMDEAGYDLTDEEDFENGKNIKTENLISRLRNSINLTPEEEKSLHVVCIAADPKQRGLQYWFGKPDEYFRRSRINNFRNELLKVVDNSDVDKLSKSALLASVKDSLFNVNKEIDMTLSPIKKALHKVEESCNDLSVERDTLKGELTSTRNELKSQIDTYRKELISEVNGASLQTIGQIIENNLGVTDKELSFFIVIDKVNDICSVTQDLVNNSLKSASIKFEKSFNVQNEFMNSAFRKGASFAKNFSVNRDQVLFIRNEFFKKIKFKPWGATNLASNITKWAGRIGAGLTVFLEVRDWYLKIKRNKELGELKENIKEALNGIFKNVMESFNDENSFYSNYAPSYMDMCKQLDERTREVENLKSQLKGLEDYKQKVSSMLKDANYTDYEEV